MKKIILYLYLALALASLIASIKNGGEVIRKQEPYTSTKLNVTEPELFKPGVVIDSFQIREVNITPDGKELYLGASNSRYYTIMVSRRINGRWTEPEIVKSIENPEYINI